MKIFQLKHVDAFTSDPFLGNPAAVVLDARGLSDQRMQQIAGEMHVSETAFILPATASKADLQIRWFTPTMEVRLCGHATIAAFHALAEDEMFGMKKPGTYSFNVQTKSGVLPVVVEKKHSGNTVEFGIPAPSFRVKRPSPSMLKALGLRRSDCDSRLPVVIDNYLYLPVRKLSTLHRMMPNFNNLFPLTKSLNVLGVCVLTLQTVEESSAVHSRFFAPVAGINEDPVTGSSNGPLGAYLYHYALPKGLPVPLMWLSDGRIEFIGEQGDLLGRKGRVKIRLAVKRDSESVGIAGEAVTIMSAFLRS